jgi:hypothetical protein
MFLFCLRFVFSMDTLNRTGGSQQLFSSREQDGGGD